MAPTEQSAAQTVFGLSRNCNIILKGNIMQHKWMNDTYRDAARILIRLLGGAMNSKDPGILLTDSDGKLAAAADIARRNGVDGLAFCAFKYMLHPPGGEIYDSLKKGWERTCYRQLCFDEERGEIIREMKKAGLSCLPLKGILISGYYPEPGMRFMADNDILYGFTSLSESGHICLTGENADAIARNTARAVEAMCGIMRGRGYDLTEVDGSVHDLFTKKPFFCFEMHRGLVKEYSKFGFYYADPWRRALPDGDGCYRFSDEDEYIYNIVHAVKHIESCGTGVRFFTDIYVFLKKKGEKLDWDYISRELETLGLVQTEEHFRNIALAAFGDHDTLTKDQEEELFFYMGCGIYGTVEMRTNILLEQLKHEKGEKGLYMRYIKSRLFLPEDVTEQSFPKLYKNRFLRPLIPAYRVWQAVTKRPKIIFTEIRELFLPKDRN